MQGQQNYFYILQRHFNTCPVGYTISSDGLYCISVVAPTITHTAYHLAVSRNGAYSNFGSRIYTTSVQNSSLLLDSPPSGEVVATMTTPTDLWINNLAAIDKGPMNRAGVWIDSNDDGVVDALTAGQQVTLSFTYDNTANLTDRIVYVGMGGDNQFTLKVNGVTIAATGPTNDARYFKRWHIFPVTMIGGQFNYFNAVGVGDGSVNDSIGMTIYDNTSAQLIAASTLSDLTILFNSQSLVGAVIDVATCPAGYSLDTSGGSGNYHCRRQINSTPG